MKHISTVDMSFVNTNSNPADNIFTKLPVINNITLNTIDKNPKKKSYKSLMKDIMSSDKSKEMPELIKCVPQKIDKI
tara:strand:- start:3482 stop:3712 length:231 start_codon:yes stop_codon:yes gene_type:complete